MLRSGMHRGLVGLIVLSAGLGCDRGSTVEGASAPAKEAVVAEAETPAGTPDGKSPAGEVEAAEQGKAVDGKIEADPETPETPEAVAEPTAEGPAPTLPEGPAGTSPWEASIDSIVTLPESKTLRVAAEVGGEQSILWAQTITAAGAAAGPPVKLRTTNGTLDSLATAFDGTTLWVGWRAGLAKGDRGLEGLAGFDLSLAQTVKTKTLRFFHHGAYDSEDDMQLVARPGVGAGVVVIALSGAVRCRGMFFEEEGMVDCALLTVDVVGPDGSVQLTQTSELEGGDPSFDVAPGDQGVAVDFIAWRGGANTDTVYVSYAAKSESMSTCSFPPVMMVWVDGGLLSLCRDPDLTDEIAMSCSPSKLSACGTFFFQRPSEAKATLKIPEKRELNFERLVLGCKGNESTLRIGWKGGHVDAPNARLGFKGPGAVMKDGKCVGTPLL